MTDTKFGERARVSMDCTDWTTIVELLKFRFSDLVEASQGVSGEKRDEARQAAKELWDLISDIELQLPHHRRSYTGSQRIIGPLRDWRNALKQMFPMLKAEPPLAVLTEEPDALELSNMADAS